MINKLILIVLLSFQLSAVANDKSTPVIAYQVTRTMDNLSFFAVGQSYAFKSIEIKMSTPGRVKKLNFSAGERVTKGALLVTQEHHLLKLQQRKDQMWDNKTSKIRTKKKFNNEQFQEALIALETAKAKVKEKKFYAPFSGVMGKKNFFVGAIVSPDDAISELINIDKIRVKFQVPEHKLSQVKKGSALRVTSKSDNHATIDGQISYLDHRLNKTTRSLMAEVVIDNNKQKILPGVFVNVEVIVKNNESKIIIPRSAIKKINDKDYVMVLKNGRTYKTAIEIDEGVGKSINVKKGLAGNEKIVAMALSKIKDNQLIKIIDYLRN